MAQLFHPATEGMILSLLTRRSFCNKELSVMGITSPESIMLIFQVHNSWLAATASQEPLISSFACLPILSMYHPCRYASPRPISLELHFASAGPAGIKSQGQLATRQLWWSSLRRHSGTALMVLLVSQYNLVALLSSALLASSKDGSLRESTLCPHRWAHTYS